MPQRMKNYAIFLQSGIVLYNLVNTVFGYEVCSYYYGTYCDDGKYCCGYDDNYCCDYTGLTTAAIVGIAIGGFIYVAVVVGLCAVCIFGVGKHRGSAGNVINPNTGTQMQVISTGQYVQPSGSGAVYPPGQAVYPPGQAPAYGPPPAGAYPPPPPAYSAEKAGQSGV